MTVALPLKILVVDDAPANQALFKVALARDGHQVILADSGEQAVQLFQTEHPNVVLMDVSMPGIGGIEATRQIRALSNDWFPIIFISALTERDDMVRGLEAGGDDYLTKPVDLILLKAKISAMQRIAVLKENLRMSNIELEQYRQQSEDQLDMARDLTEHMIRESSSPITDVELFVQAASNLSGDLIITQQSAQRDYLLLADAMGHGLTAALPLLPLVQVFSQMTQQEHSVAEVARAMNAQIKMLLPPGNFVAATLLSLDRRQRTLEIWNGANPAALLVNAQGELQRKFASRHLALGILKDREFDDSVEHLTWQQGGWLTLYSDGLTEAENSPGVAFGESGILAALHAAKPHLSLKTAVAQHLNGQDAIDDISIATVHLI